MICPACGDDHDFTRTMVAGLDTILCNRAPAGTVYAINPASIVRFPVCRICEFADREGYWGQPGTHCRDCHLSWTSSSQIHCVQCHRQFHSPAALQAHQPVGLKCINPAEHAVFAARSRENCSGTVWVLEAPESLRRLRVTPETGS